MRILCGYANLEPETEAAVKAYAPDAELVDMGKSLTAYWQEICSRWTGEQDLVIIEQDIVITPEVIPSFKACNELWCSFSYFGPKHLGHLYRSLGCTKFSAELQRLVSLESVLAASIHGKSDGGLAWDVIDVSISAMLDTVDIEPHIHGEVEHLHNYDECNVDVDYIDMHFKFGCDINPDGTFRLYKNNEDGSRTPVTPMGGDVKIPERKGQRCVVGRWL